MYTKNRYRFSTHLNAVVIVFDYIADMVWYCYTSMDVSFELFITLLATTFNFLANVQFHLSMLHYSLKWFWL